ncbi:MucR family transcriptional regulator [Mesorhizobium sp. ZMM04-4]
MLRGDEVLADIDKSALIALTAEIVSAYVTKNRLPPGGLTELIASVSDSIGKLGGPTLEPEAVPAVNPKKSVHPDYIICLEDGRKFKSMKRHLALHGMTPQQYRIKWGLPADYPMTAPNYSAVRSAMAKDIGLGQKPEQEMPAARKAPARKSAKGRMRAKVED